MRRAHVAGLLAVASVVLAVTTWERWIPQPALEFAPRAAPEGFRDLVMEGGASGIGILPFEAAGPGVGDVCAALVADNEDPRFGTGAPVAVYFTDYRCPYCRVLGEILIARAEAGELTLILKEWAILGPASVAAAEVALAAARQGAFAEAHARLARSAFVPNAAYAADLAAGLGLDPERLARDVAGPEVAAQLARVNALARELGFVGTPGLVVGRTIVSGAISEAGLDQLIRVERDLGAGPCAI